MKIKQLGEYFIPKQYVNDEELSRKSRFIIWFVYIATLIGVFFGILMYVQNSNDLTGLLTVAFFLPLNAIGLILFRRNGSFIFSSHFFCGIFFLVMIFQPAATGGIFSPDMPTIYIIPIFAMIMGNIRIGLFYAFLSLIILIGYLVLGFNDTAYYSSLTTKLTPDYFFFNLALNMGVILFLIFRNENLRLMILDKLRVSNRIISEKSKEITDSITYAKRIQQAKLPKLENIKEALPGTFVLFKPKDIVSGDFYFFKRTEHSIYIAAADCTGHGVPGAIMSMICSEKLEEAVSKYSAPSEILQHVNKSLKLTLGQTSSDESTRDGMDIALCSIDVKNKMVQYSGANRPIWIFRNDQTVMEEIKATKVAIGGHTEDTQVFQNHEIKIEAGDTFYLTSDGYADTFGKQGKKLTTKKFRELLLSIQNKTMNEQDQYLDNFIEEWKDGIEQIDDILVIGVRLL